VRTDGVGNIYVSGGFSNCADFDPDINDTAKLYHNTGICPYIAKYDASGNYIFAGKIADHYAVIKQMQVDFSGNIYIVGYFTGTSDFDPSPAIYNLSSSAGNPDAFIAKYNSSGNLIFAKNIGGASSDYAYDIAIDPFGNICITGYFNGTVDFDPGAGIANLVATVTGAGDIFIAKYDAGGNYIMAISMSGTGSDFGNSLSTDPSGNIIVTGGFETTVDFDPTAGVYNLVSSGGYDMFLAKYSPSGIMIYAKKLGGSLFDYGVSVVSDPVGNSYLSGVFSSTADFDPGAGVFNMTSAGGQDISICKYDPSGNFVFAKSIGGPNNETASAICIDSLSNIFITGSFSGTVDFDPSSGLANQTGSTNSFDGFFAKYDSAGNYLFVKDIECRISNNLYANEGKSLYMAPDGNIIVAGTFCGLTNFDPGITDAQMKAGWVDNGFVVKYDGLGTPMFLFKIGAFSTSGSPSNYSVGIKKDSYGNFIDVGIVGEVSDMVPGSGSMIVSGPTLYIAKYDSLGGLIFFKNIPYAGLADFDLDSAGNIYVTGNNGSLCFLDFDPGPGYVFVGGGLFLAKYDNNGNLIYVKSMPMSTSPAAPIFYPGYDLKIKLDPVGDIYLSGNFKTGWVDFDPGPAATVVNNPSLNYYYFIAKYDSSGNLIRANNITGPLGNTLYGFDLDSIGNVYVSGGFQNSTVDFDPGSGVTNLTAPPAGAAFIVKYSPSGALLFAKQIDKLGPVKAAVIDSSFYLFGQFAATVDFDMNPGIANVTAGTPYDAFYAKYDLSGNYLYTKHFGGSGNAVITNIKKDAEGRVFLFGGFTSSIDFDASAGIANKTSAGSTDCFIAKYDASGNYLYASSIGGTQSDGITSLISGEAGSLYFSGSFGGSVDFDPGPGTALLQSLIFNNLYIGKWEEDPCYNKQMIIDSALNATCTSQGYASAHTVNIPPPYTFSWSTIPATTDSVALFSTNGIYILSMSDTLGCTIQRSVLINGPASIVAFDLNENLIATSFRVGRTSIISLDAYNDGCVAASSNLRLILDTMTAYVNAVPPPDLINGDTLLWNIGPLIYDSAHFVPQIIVKTDTASLVGDTVCFTVISNPVIGDAVPLNNTKEYCFPVRSGLDPNEKTVYPEGTCSPHYIDDNQLLTYTIRFQNTGTDTAYNIYVMDSLDADLDLNTVRVIGSSHSVITEVWPGNALKFRFDNINLLDSTSNEALSHGYVIFEAYPLSGRPAGTQITNRVGIYFDYNTPVYTNMTLNTIYDGTLNTGATAIGNVLSADLSGAYYQWINCATGTAIAGATSQSYTAVSGGDYAVIISDGCFSDTSVCLSVFLTGVSDPGESGFSFYPNPAGNTITINTSQPTQISIVNILGETIIQNEVTNGDNIDIGFLANGVYFIRTSDGYLARLLKQ
jgi:uncharacterized repeat protein (TIGR01451 family)